jgi:hypothetical protein
MGEEPEPDPADTYRKQHYHTDTQSYNNPVIVSC